MSILDQGRILVTGGAGFIGSALIWALNRRGIKDIVIADLLGSDGKWRNLVPLRFSYYIEADRLRHKLEENPDFLGPINFVFHLGACSNTTEKDASYLVENNFEYTRFLAHWAIDQGSRFLYASSAATYGDGKQGMDDRDEDLARLRPLNPYAYSKQLFDRYAQRHALFEDIVGFKYFNVFGPNEYHKAEMRSLVIKAYQQIRDSGSVRLFKSHHPDYPDGGQMRDFLYVKDAVAITIHLAEQDTFKGIFNVGSGIASSWIDLVRPVFESLKLPEAIEFMDMPEGIRSKYQYFTRAEISKLRESGYDPPPTPLDNAVRDYVTRYLVPDRRLGD
jgi:ADP-L-glycero-D-manno-heptose 6-epimerase